MDSILQLDESGRANFFSLIMQSMGPTYICLWQYAPTTNCLYNKDGFFYEEHSQPSSSSGSLARRFFDEYRLSVFPVENEFVPGLAFKNSHPYLELPELNLQSRARSDVQRQFYQEARIKTAIFMGCKSGEIEIGLSNVSSQLDIEKEMRSWFPEDFSQQFSLLRQEQNPPSSSSSSLRSLSMDSPDSSSLLFNIPTTSHFPETLGEIPILHQVLPTTTTTSPHQQAMQEFARSRNIQFPAPESENAAMARAILAVLSSTSSSSSSSSHQPHQNLPYIHRINSKACAFKSYTSALGPRTQMGPNVHKQSMLKRSFAFFKSLNLLRLHERMQATRPTPTQLHHMISERKRREKLNESFQALRSLLPPGTKRDKASLLTTTKEYLSSLKAQNEELSRRIQHLEAQQLAAKEADHEDQETSSSSERLMVRISHVPESTSEERTVNLQVIIRGECQMVDMVIRILEFLKQVENVSLMSMETTTRILDSTSINRITMRLRIEGNGWDEAAFQEAVRRVVGDFAQ